MTGRHIQGLLLKKSGQAVRFLAGKCLELHVDERMPTFTELARLSGFSRGTLQNAMGGLCELGAVSLMKRGALGSFLLAKDTRLLLDCLGIEYITGSMPLPYTKKYEGLATGLSHSIRGRAGIQIDLAYVRGSEKRIQSVLSGRYDFAITSRMAAIDAAESGMDIVVVKDFGPRSYLTGQSIVFRDPADTAVQDGMRFGVDLASRDHVCLTDWVTRGHDVIRVPVNYSQILNMIADCELDAAIWNIDDILESRTEVNYHPVSHGADGDEHTAVLVMAAGNATMLHAVDELIDVDYTLEQQRLVVSGEIYPNY